MCQACTIKLQSDIHMKQVCLSSELHPVTGIWIHAWASLLSGTPISAILSFPSRSSAYAWKFPSPQAVGRPGLPLLPPPPPRSAVAPSTQALTPTVSSCFCNFLQKKMQKFFAKIARLISCNPLKNSQGLSTCSSSSSAVILSCVSDNSFTFMSCLLGLKTIQDVPLISKQPILNFQLSKVQKQPIHISSSIQPPQNSALECKIMLFQIMLASSISRVVQPLSITTTT